MRPVSDFDGVGMSSVASNCRACLKYESTAETNIVDVHIQAREISQDKRAILKTVRGVTNKCKIKNIPFDEKSLKGFLFYQKGRKKKIFKNFFLKN